MKYKVGDKIKVMSKVWWVDRYFTDKIGTVTGIITDSAFQYKITINSITIPVDECEIEKVATKGQQLLFEFMA